MATKRGKSQARRNSGNSSGMPGWAWLVLGVVLTIAVVMLAPRILKSRSGDGFFRPTPNPDAQPAAPTGNDEAATSDESSPPAAAPKAPDKPKATQYDFYKMLPGNEVVMSDAELAATAREETARKAKAQRTATNPVATATTVSDDNADAVDDTSPAPTRTTATVMPTSSSPALALPTNEPVEPPGNNTPYILQAGAFGAAGDAEAIKAKVALLGLSARVEGAAINGKTIYRVRMGPYSTASQLAEAKHKLASGGLPAMAIKAK